MARFARRLMYGLVVLLPLSGTAQAERKPYALDRSHCQLNFVGDALLVSAHGFFERWDAEVELDPANLGNSSLSLTIEAASINTRVERRDNHLRSPDFLDAANHPQIKFVSTQIEKVDDKNLKLTGNLTLRGTTKPIQIPVKIVFLRDGDARFRGEVQINRKDFGINYNSRLNPIEDLVNVQFDFHLVDRQAMQQRQQQSGPRPPG